MSANLTVDATLRYPTTDSQRADAEEVASAVARLERAEEDKRQYLLRRFGPSNWCVPPSANGPELIVRCAIGLPGPVQLGPIPSQRGVITQLRAEAREVIQNRVAHASATPANTRGRTTESSRVLASSAPAAAKASGGSARSRRVPTGASTPVAVAWQAQASSVAPRTSLGRCQ